MKERTKGKIANLLPPDALDGGTKMALVNAAYFKVQLHTDIIFADYHN